MIKNDVYRRLQEAFDKLSYGYPATKSGVELEILRRLYSEKDAELFLQLRQKPESLQEISKRLDRDPDVLGPHLEDMAQRGLLFHLKRGDETVYASIAFVAGVYEFQVGSMDRELAELYERYSKEAFDQATVANIDLHLRTIPVNQAIDTMPQVAPYEDARNLIKNIGKDGSIVVAECICRKQQALIGQGCDLPRETCLLFGPFGETYLDRNEGRKVSVEEALRILEQAQEAGLVTQPSSSQNPGGICNCCGDCCQSLKPLNRLSKPAEAVLSNYYAQVEPDLCTGCETCMDRCPMSAINMEEEDHAVVNLDRCIGCGLCVSSCPTEAMQLISKPENQRKIPPVSVNDQAALMKKKRGF